MKVSTISGIIKGEVERKDGPLHQATFHCIIGITVDSQGTLYVLEKDITTIRKISNEMVSSIPIPEHFQPLSITVDKNDAVFVGEYNNQQNCGLIQKIETDGSESTIQFFQKLSIDGKIQEVKDSINFPKGIAVDNAGNLWILDDKVLRKSSGDRLETLYRLPLALGIAVIDDIGWMVHYEHLLNNHGITVTCPGQMLTIAAYNGTIYTASSHFVWIHGTNTIIGKTESGYVDGEDPLFDNISAITVDFTGIYVCDENAIRKIHFPTDWRREIHYRFPKVMRSQIQALIISNWKSKKIPAEILEMIIQFAFKDSCI